MKRNRATRPWKGWGVDVYLPRTLAEALEIKAAHPEAIPIAGGTDVMVDLNFDRRRPASILDLTRAAELQTWRKDDGTITLGAGVPYTRIVRELSICRPLVEASRTVGSPQIRSRGTVGGNLGTASPAGDALPVLAAYDAEVVLASAERGERRLPWNAFLVGPKRTALAQEPAETQNLADAIRELVEPLGGIEPELPPRGPIPEPPNFK